MSIGTGKMVVELFSEASTSPRRLRTKFLLTIEAMVAEKWSDVDLDTRTLLVRRTIDEPEGREAGPLPLGREATAALRDLAAAGA